MPDRFNTILGRRVAQLRRRAGLTQAELAERVKVSVETVSRLERGATVPGVETLARMAHAIGSEPHEVLQPPVDEGKRGTKARLTEEIAHELRKLRVEDLKLVRGLVDVVCNNRRSLRSGVSKKQQE